MDSQLNEVCKQFLLHYLLCNCLAFKYKKSDSEYLCNELSTFQTCISFFYHSKIPLCDCWWGYTNEWVIIKILLLQNSISQKSIFPIFYLLQLIIIQGYTHYLPFFSMKAWSYVLWYHHNTKGEQCIVRLLVKTMSSYKYNEKVHKLYKLYCDTSMADFTFISEVIKKCII